MIFVVGPSRAGKTALLRAVLPEFPNAVLLDLDADENRRVPLIVAAGRNHGEWDGRWTRNQEILQAAESGCGIVVVDVGAGSLQTKEGRGYFMARGHSSIAVLAPWEIVLQRHQRRDPTEFRATEYSAERRAVYEAARYLIDSSRPFEESVAAMREALRNLMEDTK